MMLNADMPTDISLLRGRLPAIPLARELPARLCAKVAKVPEGALWIAFTGSDETLGIGVLPDLFRKELPMPIGMLDAPLWRSVAIQAWTLGATDLVCGRTTRHVWRVPSRWDMDVPTVLQEAVGIMGLGFSGYWVVVNTLRPAQSVYCSWP